MTLGSLARMVAKGFEGADERFTKMDARFEKIEEQMAVRQDLADMKENIMEAISYFMAKFVPRFVDITEIEA